MSGKSINFEDKSTRVISTKKKKLFNIHDLDV